MVANIAALAGLKFASGFLSSYKDSYAAKAKANEYLQNAALFRRNALIARRNGAFNEDIYRSQQRAAMAQSAAAAGELGLSSSPTTATVLATSYRAMEQNILSARYQVESEAENYLLQASVAEENARQAKRKSKNKLGSAILGGVSSLAGL